jgi:hypothetical protein
MTVVIRERMMRDRGMEVVCGVGDSGRSGAK